MGNCLALPKEGTQNVRIHHGLLITFYVFHLWSPCMIIKALVGQLYFVSVSSGKNLVKNNITLFEFQVNYFLLLIIISMSCFLYFNLI